MFDQEPPASLTAEACVLGAMILEPKCVDEVTELLGRDPAVFFSEAHGAIYAAILHTVDSKNAGDLALIVQYLKDRDELDDVGGREYLAQLADTTPGPAAVRHYAQIVTSKARLRRLAWAAGQIAYDAYHAGQLGDETGTRALDRADALISAITDIEQDDAAAESLNAIIAATFDKMKAGQTGNGVPTGYAGIDTILAGGLQKGELIIIGARPSMGKTQLALCLADSMSRQGIQTGIFSLEMSKTQLGNRHLSLRSGVSTTQMRDGTLTAAELNRLDEAFGSLLAESASPIVDDLSDVTLMQIRSRARKMVRKHGCRAIFVDYLQLLTSPEHSRESRQVEVAAISRGLKALARELNVPVVCLSQLNRDVEGRRDLRPRMSDLRESGAIEQDADVILLLHREAYYHLGDQEWIAANPEKMNLAEVIVAKQRNGPTDTVKLSFFPHTLRFVDRDESNPAPAKPAAVENLYGVFPADDSRAPIPV